MKKQKFFLILISVIACYVGSSSTPDGSISSQYSSFMSRSKRADKAIQLKSVAEQIEQVVELVNGLILTEAIVENKTSINSLIIDFLIIGQMPNNSDWIAEVASREVGTKKTAHFKELFQNTKSLQEILKKNVGTPIDVEVISNMANVVSALDVVHKIRTDAQNVKRILELLRKDSAVVDLGTYREAMTTFVETQNLMDKLVIDAPDSNAVIDLIVEAIKIPFSALEEKVSNSLKEAVKRYYKFFENKDDADKNHAMRHCVRFLKQSLAKLTLGNVDKTTADYLVNLLNLAVLSIEPKTIESVENLDDQVSGLHNKFLEIAKFDVGATSIADAEKLAAMLNSLASLNNTDFQEINFTINSLSPILQISKNMLNLSESNGKKASSYNGTVVEKFNSYYGFSNKVFSFKIMADNLAKKHLIPAEFLLAAIDHRSVLSQKLADKTFSIAQFHNGIELVDYFSSLIDGLKNFSSTLSPSGLQNHLENMNKYTNSFSKFGNISDVLPEMLERIKFSKEKRLQENVESFSSSFPVAALRRSWYKLLAKLPGFIEFTMKLREILDNRIMDVEDYDTWNKTVVETVFEEVKKKIEMIKHGSDIASELEKATEGQTLIKIESGLTLAVIAKIKESVESSALFSNWTKTNFTYSASETVNVSIKCEDIAETMRKLASNQKPIEDLIAEISHFEPLEIYNRKLDPRQVDATKNLLKAIMNAETENFTLVDKPSEQMAMLMDGSPYGSKILAKLKTGLGAFKSLISDVYSIEDLMAHASIVKSEKPDLADRIVKLLNKVKVLEIVPPPYSKDALQTLDKLAVTINNTEVLIQWIDSCQSLGQPKISKELEQLKNSSNASLAISATKLHSFVSKLDKSTARQISLLKSGLVDFEKAMSFVNCSKNQCDIKEVEQHSPNGTDKNETTTKYDWTIILIGSAVVAFVCIGLLVLFLYKKKKEKSKKTLGNNNTSSPPPSPSFQRPVQRANVIIQEQEQDDVPSRRSRGSGFKKKDREAQMNRCLMKFRQENDRFEKKDVKKRNGREIN